jgi:hypothetical protein
VSPVGIGLQDELEARGNCRYGLSGVKVRVSGHEGLFTIWESHWAADEELQLTVYPADGPSPIPLRCVDPEKHQLPGYPIEMSFHTFKCFCFEGKYPPGTLFFVPATDCTLASPWPVVCCRPKRRRKGKGVNA